jgi:hypothetical protein
MSATSPAAPVMAISEGTRMAVGESPNNAIQKWIPK